MYNHCIIFDTIIIIPAWTVRDPSQETHSRNEGLDSPEHPRPIPNQKETQGRLVFGPFLVPGAPPKTERDRKIPLQRRNRKNPPGHLRLPPPLERVSCAAVGDVGCRMTPPTPSSQETPRVPWAWPDILPQPFLKPNPAHQETTRVTPSIPNDPHHHIEP